MKRLWLLLPWLYLGHILISVLLASLLLFLTMQLFYTKDVFVYHIQDMYHTIQPLFLKCNGPRAWYICTQLHIQFTYARLCINICAKLSSYSYSQVASHTQKLNCLFFVFTGPCENGFTKCNVTSPILTHCSPQQPLLTSQCY